MSLLDNLRNRLQSPQGAPGSMPSQMQPGMPSGMPQQMPGSMPSQQMGLLQPYAGQFLPAYPGANQLSLRDTLRNSLTGRDLRTTQNYLSSLPTPSFPSFTPTQPSYGGLNDYIMRMGAGYPQGAQSSYAPPIVQQQPMAPPNSPYMGGPPRFF